MKICQFNPLCFSIPQNILSQIVDVIQSNIALQKQVHWNNLKISE